ncbi:DUF2267 domain-containing protein [Halomarina litorea]|uniref:DUF2267 domain-containing protein n=1 Tax=Halomarina litorea TaxID=2961595 RepID=UPI0020C2AFF9|nr:DUF2267 domain-containing protein [Halomarina sp. BCD28]
MDHDEFIGTVQQRADLAGRGEADSATRAVLTTLGQRITEEEAEDVAAQLPMEIGRYLNDDVEHGQQFDFPTFKQRVADTAEASDVEDDPETAAQAVASVAVEATGTGQIQDVVSQFPENEGYGGLLAGVEEAET